jgi:hypothetical protein
MILKRIFLPLIALFLVYRSVELIRVFLGISPIDAPFWLIFILVVMLNLFVTGIFAFVGFVFPTNKLLPQSYYRLKNPVLLRKVYGWLGVSYFRKMLLATFWGKEKNRKKYFDGTKAGLANFDYQTRQSEFGHVAAFVAITGLSVLLLFYGHHTAFALAMAINILANFYPIILQRTHRIQLEKLSQRLNRQISTS